MDGSKLNYKTRAKLEVFYTGGAVRLSSDGATLACACADEVKLVDVQTGAVQKTIAGDTEPVTSLALSPDGRLIFVASRSLQLRCFSLETGEQLRTFKGHRAPVADLAVDTSGALLASASADRSARVWDIDGGYCTHNFTGHSGVVLCCAFHPTQLLLATGSDDTQVRVWDLVAKTCIATLQGHFSAVTSLSLSPDGWSLLSGGRDGVVIAWSLRNHTKVTTVPVYEAIEGLVALPASVCGISAHPPPLCFATGGEKGTVKLWRADTGKCIYDAAPPGVGAAAADGSTGVVELRPLPGGGGLVAGTQDCRLLVLNAHAGDLSLATQLIGNNDEVTDVKFITANASSSNTAVLRGDEAGGGSGAPTHVAVASNGPHIRLFDCSTLSCTATLDGHAEAVLALDALRLKVGTTLLASGSKDNTVRLWTAPEGRCIGVGKGHVGAVSAVAFARKGGGFLVSGGADKLLKVWDTRGVVGLEAGQPPAALRATAAVAAHAKDINAVAVAPNDSLVASASQDRTVKVWQLPNLVLSLTLKGHKRGVWSVVFSPVDKALATASGDKTVKLWSLQDGACLRTFEGHLSSVLRVDFLSAGTQLVSAGGDGLLKLWNMRTSECTNTFDAHEDKVWALALGSAGNLLASGGADGGVILWEDCTAADAQGAAKDAEVVLHQQQALSNALRSRNWGKAAGLALDMRHPGSLLTVVTAAVEGGAGGRDDGGAVLRRVVAGLSPERVRQCLEYAREWNTNGRTCFAAQALLGAVLRSRPPAELMAIPGVGGLLEALESYTKRHFARADRLVRSTFVVDYVLGTLNVLTPADEGDAAASGGEALLANGHHAEGEEGLSSEEDSDGEGGPQEMPKKRKARGRRKKRAPAAVVAPPPALKKTSKKTPAKKKKSSAK